MASRTETTASVFVHRWRGEAAITLASGAMSATFLPELNLLGVSLRLAGEEFLALPGGVAAYRARRATGLPLLAPWANRLDGTTYRVGRVRDYLDGLDLTTDGTACRFTARRGARPGGSPGDHRRAHRAPACAPSLRSPRSAHRFPVSAQDRGHSERGRHGALDRDVCPADLRPRRARLLRLSPVPPAPGRRPQGLAARTTGASTSGAERRAGSRPANGPGSPRNPTDRCAHLRRCLRRCDTLHDGDPWGATWASRRLRRGLSLPSGVRAARIAVRVPRADDGADDALGTGSCPSAAPGDEHTARFSIRPTTTP